MRAQAVTSKSHVRQNRGRVDICRQTHLPPLCGLSFPRLLGFAGEANRVAADQQMRRKAVTRRQTEHNPSHLGGIADFFTPIRLSYRGRHQEGHTISALPGNVILCPCYAEIHRAAFRARGPAVMRGSVAGPVTAPLLLLPPVRNLAFATGRPSGSLTGVRKVVGRPYRKALVIRADQWSRSDRFPA